MTTGVALLTSLLAYLYLDVPRAEGDPRWPQLLFREAFLMGIGVGTAAFVSRLIYDLRSEVRQAMEGYSQSGPVPIEFGAPPVAAPVAQRRPNILVEHFNVRLAGHPPRGGRHQ